MNRKPRQQINVKTVKDVSKLGHMTKEELLSESEKYDIDNYNPIDHNQEKEVLIPKNKTEVITLRLTPKENELIKNLADEKGLSKSAFIRMVLKTALKEEHYQ